MGARTLSERQDNFPFGIFENNKTVPSARGPSTSGLWTIGARNGVGVADVWFDSWDVVPETHPHAAFKESVDAARVGHPER